MVLAVVEVVVTKVKVHGDEGDNFSVLEAGNGKSMARGKVERGVKERKAKQKRKI